MTWTVRPWSLAGTLAPLLSAFIGVGNVVLGAVGMVVPWGGSNTPASFYPLELGVGLLLALVGLGQLVGVARTVFYDRHRREFRFVSRRREVVTARGEVVSIGRLIGSLDWLRIYPLVVTTTAGRFYLSQSIFQLDELMDSIARDNHGVEMAR